MRKKLLAVLTTATLVLAMNLSVFAAGSPTTEDTSKVEKPGSQKAEVSVENLVTEKPSSYVEKLADTTAVVNGEAVEAPVIEAVSDTTVEATVAEVKQQLNNIAAVADAIDSKDLEKAATDANKVVVPEVKAVAEVKAPAGVVVSETSPITITFPVSGIKAGANVMILHWTNSAWEVIKPDSVKDGAVVATFKSLSPVAIVEVKVEEKAVTPTPAPAPAPAPAPQATPTPAPAVTAPKTGEPVSVFAVMALMSVAGIGVCSKKIKEK